MFVEPETNCCNLLPYPCNFQKHESKPIFHVVHTMLKVAHSQHITTLCIQKDGEKPRNKGSPLIHAYFIPGNMCQGKFVRNLTLFQDSTLLFQYK